jgi:hypothetical protein
MCYFAETDNQIRRKVPCFYTNLRFKINLVRIKFSRQGFDRWFGPLIERVVNMNNRVQACYERHFSWHWPAKEIVYVLTPDK